MSDFDDLVFQPVKYEDVKHNYQPRNMRLSRWERRIQELEDYGYLGAIAGFIAVAVLLVTVVAVTAGIVGGKG